MGHRKVQAHGLQRGAQHLEREKSNSRTGTRKGKHIVFQRGLGAHAQDLCPLSTWTLWSGTVDSDARNLVASPPATPLGKEVLVYPTVPDRAASSPSICVRPVPYGTPTGVAVGGFERCRTHVHLRSRVVDYLRSLTP